MINTPAMAACAHCGRQLSPNVKFCPSCGRPAQAGSATAGSSAPPPPVYPAPPTIPVSQSGSPKLPGFLRSFSRWDLAALLGGALAAWLWWRWSKMDVPDKVTPRYILMIPILIVLLRKPLDMLLTPLQAVKRHIPRLLLIVVGLALPYFLANYFYKNGVSNFPLAQKSIIWGTILSYVVLRIPDPNVFAGRRPQQATAVLSGFSVWIGVGLLLLLQCIAADLAWADDFSRDYRRLEDGLRTDGWAQTIAGTASTVINGLVNGALVFQSGNYTPSEKGEAPTRYTMDIRTEDERTRLAADGRDRLWIYARILCSKPAVDVQSLTSAIQFSFQGQYASWVSIRGQKFSGGYKAVMLAAEPPTPQTELPEDASFTALVSGRTAEGEPIEIPVQIRLEPEPSMEVEILA